MSNEQNVQHLVKQIEIVLALHKSSIKLALLSHLKHCLLQYLVDYTNGQSNLSVISLSHSCSQVSQGNQLSGQ